MSILIKKSHKNRHMKKLHLGIYKLIRLEVFVDCEQSVFRCFSLNLSSADNAFIIESASFNPERSLEGYRGRLVIAYREDSISTREVESMIGKEMSRYRLNRQDYRLRAL